MAALLRSNDIDIVARLHQGRKYDFRRGQRLGEADHVVSWHKPERPEWMSEELYDLLPNQIRKREIYRRVERPVYRVKELIIATIFLDAHAKEADYILEL